MPNRMLRPWINSEKVNTLSVYSERFFTRLIMVVDDYGCFHANEKLLRSNLFPLLLEVVKEADISRWLTECQKTGLIVIYDADGKKYLQILDFRQRLDRAKAKYPLPNTSLTIVNDFPPEAETKSELEQRRVLAPDPNLGVVVYDAEDTLLKNQIELERICVAVGGVDMKTAKESLHKYHLYLEEKEQYPKGKKAIYAGFEKWLRNEKNFTPKYEKVFTPVTGPQLKKI